MGRKLTEVLDNLSPERRQRIADERDQILAEIETLRDLRAHADVDSQGEVARTLGVSQAAVSKTEHRDLAQTSLAALDRYVQALGGSVDIQITIPGKPPVRLSRLSDLQAEADLGNDTDPDTPGR